MPLLPYVIAVVFDLPIEASAKGKCISGDGFCVAYPTVGTTATVMYSVTQEENMKLVFVMPN